MAEQVTFLGRYEILKSLGAGGMGEVFLARQKGVAGMDRLVVVKTVLPHLAREPGFIERFLDEMRVSMLLSHGNIVQVYEVGEADGRYYMAMEWVDGLDLREVLRSLEKAGRQFPEELAVHVAMEVGKGLAYAHSKRDQSGRPLGIVHRDVSPANILISYDGQVKITDFGVAVATSRISFSIPGTLHGKLAYMSPEQVSGGEIDGRSDQFSLGVVLYEMLSGERPFDAETEVALIEQIRRCEPKPLEEVAPWVERELSRIVMRMLAREPEARFSSMDDVAEALGDYLFRTQKFPSPKQVACFMAELRGQSAERADVDKALEGLLASEKGDSGDVTLEARAHDVKRPRPLLEESRFGVKQVLAALALLVAVSWVAWLAGRHGGVVSPHDDAEVVEVGVNSGADVSERAGVFDGSEDTVATDEGDEDNAGVEEERAVPQALYKSVYLRSLPAGAEVYLGTRKIGTTPLTLAVGVGKTMRLELRRDGYEPSIVTLNESAPANLVVEMVPVAKGRVRFRFFPANARVLIDDQEVPVSGNLVDMDIRAGTHVLCVRSSDDLGPAKTLKFELKPGAVVELGTIELPLEP